MLQNDLWIHFHIPATILTIHTVPAVDWDMVGCWRNPRQNNISSELHYQPCCISKFAQEQVLNFLCIDLLTPPTVPDMQGIILGHSRNPMRQPHLRLQFQPPSTFLPIQIHKVSCSDFKDYYSFYLSSRSGSGQDGSGTKADSEVLQTDLCRRFGLLTLLHIPIHRMHWPNLSTSVISHLANCSHSKQGPRETEADLQAKTWSPLPIRVTNTPTSKFALLTIQIHNVSHRKLLVYWFFYLSNCSHVHGNLVGWRGSRGRTLISASDVGHRHSRTVHCSNPLSQGIIIFHLSTHFCRGTISAHGPGLFPCPSSNSGYH